MVLLVGRRPDVTDLALEDLTGKEDGSATMADISQDGRNIYVMWSLSESAIWMLTLEPSGP